MPWLLTKVAGLGGREGWMSCCATSSLCSILVDDTCGLYCGTGRRAQDHSAAAAVVSSCRARACVRLWSVVECVSVSLSASSICEAPQTALQGFVWSRGHTTPARQHGSFECSWVLLPHSPSGGFALAVPASICQHWCGELTS